LIRYPGTVLRVEGSLAWVECARAAPCAVCPGRLGCDVAAFAGAPAFHRLRARVHGCALQPGARVNVGVPPRSVLRAALLAYGLPLFALVAGALAGELIAPAAAVAGAGLGLLGGVALGGAASRRFPVAPPVVLDAPAP
jgi:sigma-E factor negative regulatory protein RseC